MSYFKEHSISVGYNNTGQEFFNILKKYEKYIHSYFFSPFEGMTGENYDENKVYETLKNCNTYSIPGNILFNTNQKYNYFDTIDKYSSLSSLDIQAVTILSPADAIKIKEKYPDLKIHLSVRYFDWDSSKNSLDYLIDEELIKYINVINISGAKSFTDHEIIQRIHDLGIQTKMILNEDCMQNRSGNYQKFIGEGSCNNSECRQLCKKAIEKFNWLCLSAINVYKEMVQYYDIDIWKLSSRDIVGTECIDKMLDEYTSESSTEYIYNEPEILETHKDFNKYLEWCNVRTHCSGDCYKCRKCEKYYEYLK